jgi:hypothetical protein
MLLAVVLVCWLLLTLPAAVLMGKCIARGLAPSEPPVAPSVPAQRSPVGAAVRERAEVRAVAQSGLSHA